MMKKLLLLITLVCSLFFTFSANAILFEVDGITYDSYQTGQYSAFINALRHKFAEAEGQGNLTIFMTNDDGIPAEITIRLFDMYIIAFNNVRLEDQSYRGGEKQKITYHGISKMIREVSRNPQSAEALRVLSFVTAEAVRFQFIEDAVNSIFNDPAGPISINWYGYLTGMHEWAHTSEFMARFQNPPLLLNNNARTLDDIRYVGIPNGYVRRYFIAITGSLPWNSFIP